MERRNLPISCPSCGALLRVRRFECPACRTSVEGDFELSLVARLTPEEQAWVVTFVKHSGSLKDLARTYGVSYPTVRNRLDNLIERLQTLEAEQRSQTEEPVSE